jgi:hypothetical protein
MLKGIKILLLLILMGGFISCSSGDTDEPNAGFSLKQEKIVQWDEVEIVNKSDNAAELSYEVSGGQYVFIGNYEGIRFLEGNSYTVTQIARNEKGEDRYSLTVEVAKPDNYFILSGEKFLTGTDATFEYDGQNQRYIKIMGTITGQDKPNMVMLYTISGKFPIEGSYAYNTNGDIGTFDVVMKAEYAGSSYAWTTQGDGTKQLLNIELIYEDPKNEENNAYTITMPDYNLNYGKYVFFPQFYFDSWGNKPLSLFYKGTVQK